MSLQTQHDPKNEAEITTGIALAAAVGSNANNLRTSSWVRSCKKATLERAQLRQGERVVDIGCGTGASSIALAERAGPSGQVLGVDVSAPMLARGAERMAPGCAPHSCGRRVSISYACAARLRSRHCLWRRDRRGPRGRDGTWTHKPRPAGPGPGNACRGCHVDPPRVATLSTR